MEKRLGIFTFYDKDGAVDQSVVHLLRELDTVTSKIVIVCNGDVTEEGMELLKEYAANVLVRENTGYDAAAYKEALERYVGWEDMAEYQELILCNATFFGPFCSLEQIFHEMQPQPVDFWGLTEHGALRAGEHEVTRHLQSYFLVVRECLLHSADFKGFWAARRSDLTDVEGVIDDFEVAFTRQFEEKGYVWTSYADTRGWEGEEIEHNFNPLVYLPYTMMKNLRLPILKKRFWPWTQAEKTLGDEYPKALEYIKNNTSYDIKIIWDYLIRHQELKTLWKVANLNYIRTKWCVSEQTTAFDARIVVIFLYRYSDSLSLFEEYFTEIAPSVVIFREHILESASKWQVLRRKYRDLRKNYDYVAVLCDYDSEGNHAPYGISMNRAICENLVSSMEYVSQVVKILEEHRELGLLYSPMPCFADGRRENCRQWYYEFSAVQDMKARLKLDCVVEETDIPELIYQAFWCRADSLSELLDMKILKTLLSKQCFNDYALERLLPHLVQTLGYASGSVQSDVFATQNCANMQTRIFKEPEPFDRDLELRALLDFSRTGQRVYIYGAGQKGMRIYHTLQEYHVAVEGFMVSDNQYEDNRGKELPLPVYSASKLRGKRRIKIVVALNPQNVEEIKDELNSTFRQVYYAK